MGYIGYYLKKDKWWGLLILLPMMLIIANDINAHLSNLIFSFPRHLLSYIFCLSSLIIYPLFIFKKKIIRLIGLIISLLLIISFSIIPLINKPVYDTFILCSGDKYSFDNTYEVYLKDDKFGKVSIEEIENLDGYCVHSKFIKAGNTELIMESANGIKKTFDLKIKRYTYTLEEKID